MKQSHPSLLVTSWSDGISMDSTRYVAQWNENTNTWNMAYQHRQQGFVAGDHTDESSDIDTVYKKLLAIEICTSNFLAFKANSQEISCKDLIDQLNDYTISAASLDENNVAISFNTLSEKQKKTVLANL